MEDNEEGNPQSRETLGRLIDEGDAALDRLLGGGPSMQEALRMSKKDMLTPYNCGCLPLRHAIRGSGASLEVVCLLLREAPESASVANKHGNIALSGIRKETPFGVALLVVERTPPSAMLKADEDGDLPLHCLIQNRVSDEVLKRTIERCPPAVFAAANKQGRFPLHEAVRECTSPYIVQLLTDRSPAKVLVTGDADGKMPLHCLGSKASLDVTAFLIRRSPSNALSQLDKRKRTPLHCAVNAFAPVEVIEQLIKKSPASSLLIPDTKGKLPLHSVLDTVCVDSLRKHEILCLLIQNSPSRVFVTTDVTGRLPLHCIRHPFNRQGIEMLIARSPPCSLNKPDIHGRTPLNRVLDDRHVSIDIVELLTPRSVPFGEVMLAADEGGRTLLHAAVHGRVSPEVIQHLLDRAGDHIQQVLTRPDGCGQLPLHCVLDFMHRGDVAPALVSALIGPHPYKTLFMADNKGQVPLHNAILCRAPTVVVRQILMRCPTKILTTTDKRGRIPLECAIEQGSPIDIVELLVERTPVEYISQPDQDGKTLLHKIQRPVSPEVVRLLTRRSPEILMRADKEGRLAIHHAVKQRVSLRVMEILVEECSQSLLIADQDGHLPVHFAAKTRASVAAALIEQSGREGLMSRNHVGQLPLHRAVIDRATPDIVEKFVDCCPEALLCFDNAGHLPLFYALQALLRAFDGTPALVVFLLIQRSPVSLSTADLCGRLPLHDCMILNVFVDRPVVRMLRLYPDAAKHADHEGKLPLHYALENQMTSATVAKLLLDSFPGAVNWRDNSGRLPLEIACEADAPLNIIYSLYRSCPV